MVRYTNNVKYTFNRMIRGLSAISWKYFKYDQLLTTSNMLVGIVNKLSAYVLKL